MARDKRIDVAKAIGITLVVWGHAGGPYSSMIFRFHMALFFILSGWCFKDVYLDTLSNLRSCIWKKVKGLYLPFIIFNGITLTLRNLFILLNIYTDNEAFLEPSSFGGGNGYGITMPLTLSEMKPWIINIFKFSGETQLGGATWFLRVLFGLTVIWACINFVLKTIAEFDEKCRMIINIIISLFFMIAAYRWMQMDIHLLFQIETVAAAYILFTFGYYAGKSHTRMTPIQNVVIGLIALIILRYCDIICNQNGWNSNVNEFANPWMYLVTSLSGFCLIMTVSSLICNFKSIKIIEYMGKHTLIILCLHFTCFKLVTFIQCLVYGEPLYRLASFPVFNSSGLWWLAYSVCGLVMPLLISMSGDMIRKNYTNRRKQRNG